MDLVDAFEKHHKNFELVFVALTTYDKDLRPYITKVQAAAVAMLDDLRRYQN
ncbi:hypothetical protein ACG2LH_17255 [Zhouia sp. PK063]|uniref:hypothetical protein n=1 Tax=Zhouia sp. PK063 TaxID=3373602 RepID=UPI0037B6D52A